MLFVYVLIGLDWAEPMMLFVLHVTSHAFWCCLGLFWLFFSFSTSISVYIPMLLHLLILHLLTFGSMMMMLLKHFRRTSLDEAFIRNAKSFCRTLPTPTFLLSFTVGDGSHCVMSRSHVLSCLSRSSTPTCTGLIVQYHSSSLAFEVHAFLSHCS